MNDITLEMLPSEVQTLLQIDGVVLAGGAIRDLIKGAKPKDYDLFFTSREAADEVNKWLIESCADTVGNGSTLTARFDTLVVQSIYRNVYESPWKLIADFDFKNVCGFMTRTEGHFREIKKAEETGEVVVNCIQKPLKELRRLAKYQQKGYQCDDAFRYIVDVMSDKGAGIILMSDFYDAAVVGGDKS